jgi:hypothetical protein
VNNPISNLQKVFESRIRLGIMSALMVNDTVDFNALKEIIVVSKQFVGRKPSTTYKATRQGRDMFRRHLAALENLIKKQ